MSKTELRLKISELIKKRLEQLASYEKKHINEYLREHFENFFKEIDAIEEEGIQ